MTSPTGAVVMMPSLAQIEPQLLVSGITAAVMIHVILLIIAYAIYAERKVSAYIQDRLGPNRTGFDFGQPWLQVLGERGPFKGFIGLGQSFADGLKFLLKEDFKPTGVDALLFTLAPAMMIIPALLGFMIIPWGGNLLIDGELTTVAGADVSVGVVYLLAVAAMGVYGVTIGGWASNNKYSFLGGLRATAQMISYEIPMGLSLLCVLLVAGTVIPMGIISYQIEHGWLVLAQPVAALLFFIAILAEANRAPFDNAEAEQELVGGYHTEYSSMRFALFFLAEYAHMITSAAFLVLLFFGGYHLPLGWALGDDHLWHPESVGLAAVVVKTLTYLAKVVLVILFMMLIRWTLPRLRYDQVMMLGWYQMIPVSLAVLVLTSVAMYLGWTAW